MGGRTNTFEVTLLFKKGELYARLMEEVMNSLGATVEGNIRKHE